MSNEPAPSPAVAEILRVYGLVPQLSRLRQDVLMGDVWQQPELAQRDKSLVTCAILAALGRNDELASHLQRAVSNGITPDEIRGMAVHVAFYAGWPAGLSVGRAALDILEGEKEG